MSLLYNYIKKILAPSKFSFFTLFNHTKQIWCGPLYWFISCLRDDHLSGMIIKSGIQQIYVLLLKKKRCDVAQAVDHSAVKVWILLPGGSILHSRCICSLGYFLFQPVVYNWAAFKVCLRIVAEKCELPPYSEHRSTSKMAASNRRSSFAIERTTLIGWKGFSKWQPPYGAAICNKRTILIGWTTVILEEPFASFSSTLKLETHRRRPRDRPWMQIGQKSIPEVPRSRLGDVPWTHPRSIEGCEMCCLVCEKVHIKDPLLFIRKHRLCDNIGFSLKKCCNDHFLYAWRPIADDRKINVL